MKPTIVTFVGEALPFVKKFDAFITRNQLAGKICADHICYKCGTRESFEYIRALFESSTWYYQAMISGRRIAVVRLPSPLATLAGDIHYLELSDQKPDGSQVESFDHIEAYPTAMNYEEFVAQLTNTEKVVYKERPHHSTHDVDIGEGFLFRSTSGPLIKKIISEEMT